MQSPKKYFETHASVDVFFFTADGLAFFDKNTADSHANSLTDKTVKKVTREEAEAEVEEDEETIALNKKIEAATKVVDKAEGVVAAKKAALEKVVDEKKKPAAEDAIKGAEVKLEEAKAALAALQPAE